MPEKIDPNTLIATFDVTIPHELGKQAISFWIDKYPDTLYLRFNKKIIIEIILNNNSFQFNNINYIQTQGTAMGTKMTPTYAILTQPYLEKNLYEIIGKKKYSHDKKEEFTKSWMIASYSGNTYGETSTNCTTYDKTYTPKWNLQWNTA